MAPSILGPLETQDCALALLVIANDSDTGAAHLALLSRLLIYASIVTVERSFEDYVSCQVCGRLVPREETCFHIQQHFIHGDLKKQAFASVGQGRPEVTEALVQHTIAAKLIETLQFVLQKWLKIALKYALVVQSAKRLSIGAFDRHVLMCYNVHRCLQGYLAFVICPALRGIVQFA